MKVKVVGEGRGGKGEAERVTVCTGLAILGGREMGSRDPSEEVVMRLDDVRRSGNVRDRGGRRGGLVGGGLGAVVIAVVVLLLGGDPQSCDTFTTAAL